MKSDKERKDLNQVLIPRDIGDLTKRRKQLYGHAGMPSNAPHDVAPTFLGSSTEDSKTRDKAQGHSQDKSQDSAATPEDEKADKKPKKRIHGKKKATKAKEANKDDDYMKAYLKKKAAKEKEMKEKIKKNAVIEAQEKAKQLRIDTEQRVKARDLQNQIRLWESYRGQPGYDETQVDAMIVTFKTQLNGIDPKYWY
ncbi:MAG: hypothetical protein AB7S81_05645 [Bdellovibrionales bacterium]